MTRPRLTVHDPEATPRADPDALLTLREVCSLLGVSITAGERLKAQGRLPPHLEITRRTHRWRRSAVLDYLRRLEEETARRQARLR
jgi:predicted DNA-binding transcriptional regulator AlpA